MRQDLESDLEQFAAETGVAGKGALSLMLAITRRAREEGLPLDPDKLLTPKGGQVSGASGGAVRKILLEHGIERHLSSEGGRTSRGSIDRMKAYVAFLNARTGQFDEESLRDVEAWWAGRVVAYFQSEPMEIRDDGRSSVRKFVGDLIALAERRQQEAPGTQYAGAMLQHLVGAKLEMALPNDQIEHHGASVADGPTGRGGDFVVGDAAIHVTSAPSEALIRRCTENLNAGIRPVIVTTVRSASVASGLCENKGLSDQVDILPIEDFLATNLFEWARFRHPERREHLLKLIETYNALIEEHEHDSSLKIRLV